MNRMPRSEFRTMLSTEFISITGGLVAGMLLTFATDKIDLVPGLLILLPGFLEMRGAISGSLSARLSSGLFLGVLKPRPADNRVLRGNVIASILLVVITSALLGIVTYGALSYFFGVSSPRIILVALIAGVLSNVIEIPLTIISTFWFFRKGIDPNDVMGPYITTTGDIISVISLLIALAIV